MLLIQRPHRYPLSLSVSVRIIQIFFMIIICALTNYLDAPALKISFPQLEGIVFLRLQKLWSKCYPQFCYDLSAF